jgi:hypothetical protein
METFEVLGHDGKFKKAKIIKNKSKTVFVISWNEKESRYTKLIDLQDPENCSK